MKDKVQRFIDNIGGNFVEISYKDAIYQCMDLVYAWIFVLDIPKSTIQHLYAYEVWTKPRSITKEYFDLLENTPDFVPVAGDLAVYKGGEAGHIGIVADNNNDVNGFNIFEQNLPLGANPRVRRSSYNNIIGFLRPKQKVVPQPEPIIEDDTVIPQIIDEQGNAMQVHAIRSTINDMKRDFDSLKKSVEGKVNEAVEKERVKQLRECEERVKILKASVETEYKDKLADQESECQDDKKELRLELERMAFRKAKDLPASTLFRFALRKLFRLGK